MTQETTSVLIEVPSDLHELLKEFLQEKTALDQSAAYAAGLALLISKECDRTQCRRAARDIYIRIASQPEVAS